MKLLDRIVERAAALLVDRLLAEDRYGKPNGSTFTSFEENEVNKPKPEVDEDGDLRCECGRVFVTPGAFKQHRTKMHGGGPG